MGCIKANVGLVNKHLSATINKVSEGLKANIGVVCTPNTDAYIKVSPNILWFLNEHEILDVGVMSNIKWIVK